MNISGDSVEKYLNFGGVSELHSLTSFMRWRKEYVSYYSTYSTTLTPTPQLRGNLHSIAYETFVTEQ